jgi:hypothetical protein
MATSLVVKVIGDSSSLEKSLHRSSVATKKFDKDISHTFRGVVAGSGAFRSLGRSIAFASAGFLGGVGLTALVRGAFEEMSNVQKAAAQTNAVLKSTGGIAGVTAGHVDELAKSLLNLSGVDDEVIKGGENLLLTFTNVRNIRGVGNKIFDRATLDALDVATRRGVSFQSVILQLGKALQDPVKGLTRLQRVGLTFSASQTALIKRLSESGHVLEAQKIILSEVEKRYRGAAAAAGDTLSGKLNILKETIRNVGGEIALQMLPAITKVVDRLLAWVQNTDNQNRILNDSKQVISAVGGALRTLKGIFDGLNKITGSTKETLKQLFIAFAAFKTLEIAGGLAQSARSIGLIGTNARTASGEVSGLRGNLRNLAAIGVIGVAIEVILHKKEITDEASKIGIPFADKSGLDLIRMAFPDAIGPKWIQKKLGLQKAAKGVGNDAANAITKARKTVAEAIKKAIANTTSADLPGVVPPRPKVDPKLRRQANEAARQAALDRADLAVARAQATKSLTDDLVALRKENALIAKRIRGGHDTIALERQQLDVQNQITAVLQQQAEARKAQEQARIEARSTRQFRRLGLGPGGEDLVPGVTNLKKQLASVTDAISGSFLDTSKTRQKIQSIRAVLKAGVGNISKDVRQTIQQMIADLRDKLNQAKVDVTKFQTAGRGQFTLAGAHPHGTAGAGGIVVNGGIHLHGIQNVKELENALAKRTKQRAHKRRAV